MTGELFRTPRRVRRRTVISRRPRRWRIACGPDPWTRSRGRRVWSARTASCAARSPRTVSVVDPVGPARRRQDDARAADRVSDLVALSVVLGGRDRRQGDARGPRASPRHAVRHRKRTILFLDEIHRFNRSQQDVFLPYVEAGDIVLVGATTENPSFELNGALLSRCKVVVLEPLTPEAIARIVERALGDSARGLGARDFAWTTRRSLSSRRPRAGTPGGR